MNYNAQPEPAACEHDWCYGDHDRTCSLCMKVECLARDMTVRERMAMAAMQSLIGIPAYKDAPADRVASWAVESADALIAALKEKPE